MLASVSLARINSALRVRTAPASFAESAIVNASSRSSRNIGPSHRYTLNADYVHGLILFPQGRCEEARAIAEETYALAKGIFAPTHLLLADLAQLLAEIEGGSTPQKPLPQDAAASLQLTQSAAS
jgi:hypothetical protein